MSLQTELLGLFQYEESDGANTFNLDKALNENWDKIDAYLKGVLLSDLSNADEATLQAAVKAIVLQMVANNLTTTAANLLLDARQGKVLSDVIKAHLADTDNPHNVTLAQIGAAAAAHSHDVSDIISGIFGVPYGGTGASSFTSNYPLFGDGTGPLKAHAPLAAMALLGDGYGTCATAAATTAKVVTLADFKRRTGSRVTVYFTYAVPASATMNVNSTGAAAIRAKGAAIAAGVIPAASYADFFFDGTYWQLITVANTVSVTTGSYTGTGTYGSSNQNTLTFARKPLMIFVGNTPSDGGAVRILFQGTSSAGSYYSNDSMWTLTWSTDGKTVSWYGRSAAYQGNASGTAYPYVAIYGE